MTAKKYQDLFTIKGLVPAPGHSPSGGADQAGHKRPIKKRTTTTTNTNPRIPLGP
jgi:hypothetical protein